MMSWHAYYASVIRIIKGTPAQETMPSGGHRWGSFPCNCRHGLRGSGK